MDRYLRRTPVSVLFDRIGLKALIFGASSLFFILLWGARPSAFAAGFALALLALTLLKKGEARRLKRREKKLREELGGELTLERLLLTPQKRAHFETVLLLSSAYDITLENTLESGVLCQIRGEKVLVALLQKHRSLSCGAQDVLEFQRRVKEEGAIRGVLCLACGADENARTQAARKPNITLFSRRTLACLAGAANPATDEQLISLGREKRERAPSYMFLRRVLARSRAPRYALYGSLLLLLYVLTGLPYYPVPGVLLVLLAAFSRARPGDKETL